MNVLTARERKQRRLKMIYTIDTDNNISAFATPEEAAAGTTAVETFASQKELAGLAGTWPAERVTAIWNSLPGVKEVKGFKTAKAGASRIWERIQKLGDSGKTEEQSKSKASKKAGPAAKPAKSVRAKANLGKKASATKNSPKAKRAAKSEAEGPREGSKTAQVVAMLQRKNGATITEIMDAMGWQRHTVRGFMAGAMKKAGYTVESFKPEGGERSYRIQK
jgi:Protein of unknown function (DUF3489)